MPNHIKDLIPDPKNRRAHNPRNIGMVVEALQTVGAARSIVIDEDDVILAGNGVTEAAAEAGITKVRVIEADGDEIIAVRRSGLSAEQKRALAIYDNRTAELASWDVEQLREDIKGGLDLKPFFFPEELREVINENGRLVTGRTDPDEVPSQRPTDIARGDFFELGSHRLLCGDCTVESDVVRLMGDERAGLMNTDPPYGIAYQNEDLHPDAGPIRRKVANDDKTGAAIQPFLEAAFGAAQAAALKPDAGWYLWHGMLTQGFFAAAAAAAAANVVLHRQIIWVKPVLVFGRGQYHWKHELCFMGWVDGHQPPDYGLGNGERTQTTVWEVAGVSHAERKEYNHSTPKPVGLFTIPIVKHLKEGEAAYEPFAGSGPQIIAAEQLGRRCFAMDIEPSCCQVIIDRWEAFTGQKAVKVGEAIRA